METQKRIVPKQKVDRRLLEQELAKRGETFCSASKRLGFTQSYLSAMLSPDGKRDELPRHTIVALYAKFGISAETITPGYEPKEEAMTQTERVEQYMKDFRSITQLEAIRDLGVMRLASRISDMRRQEEAVEQPKVEQPIEQLKEFESVDLAEKSKAEAFANALYDLIRAACEDAIKSALG